MSGSGCTRAATAGRGRQVKVPGYIMNKNLGRVRSSPPRVTATAAVPRLEEGRVPSPPPASGRSTERRICISAMNTIILLISFLSSVNHSVHSLALNTRVP